MLGDHHDDGADGHAHFGAVANDASDAGFSDDDEVVSFDQAPNEARHDSCSSDEGRDMNTHKDIVIVTGSSGFIGCAVVNRFAEQYRVIGFDAEGPPHPPPAAECVCVDVTSTVSASPR